MTFKDLAGAPLRFMRRADPLGLMDVGPLLGDGVGVQVWTDIMNTPFRVLGSLRGSARASRRVVPLQGSMLEASERDHYITGGRNLSRLEDGLGLMRGPTFGMSQQTGHPFWLTVSDYVWVWLQC